MATQKMATQKNGDTKSGGAGGTPLAVTQEDCLVHYDFNAILNNYLNGMSSA